MTRRSFEVSELRHCCTTRYEDERPSLIKREQWGCRTRLSRGHNASTARRSFSTTGRNGRSGIQTGERESKRAGIPQIGGMLASRENAALSHATLGAGPLIKGGYPQGPPDSMGQGIL